MTKKKSVTGLIMRSVDKLKGVLVKAFVVLKDMYI